MICVVCGKEFTPTGKNQKYCSFDCGYEAKRRKQLASYPRKPAKLKVCPVCGKEFKTRNSRKKYCSDACGRELKKRLKEKNKKRNCLICGAEFEARTNTHKYCSVKCRRAAEKIMSRKYCEKRKEKAGKKNICVVCGKEFLPSASHRITCSAKCSKIRKVEREKLQRLKAKKMRAVKSGELAKPRICEICGKEYLPVRVNQKFCSLTCRDEAFQKHKAGATKNPNTEQKEISQRLKEATDLKIRYSQYYYLVDVEGKTREEIFAEQQKIHEETIRNDFIWSKYTTPQPIGEYRKGVGYVSAC